MDYQMIINIVLIILVVVLAALLLIRYRDEKKLSAVKNIRLEEYSDFLLSNANDGSIVEVAKRMSDLLVNVLGCRYIVFLRKKKGVLDLNYYHNIRNFHPKDFHLEYKNELDKVLKADYLPRSINLVKNYLTPEFKKQTAKFGIDTFFPIFWRENLYGLYFVKSNVAVQSPLFSVLLASLAQSLSAAYHIKWHETRLEKNSSKQTTTVKSSTSEDGENVEKILKLIQNRKSSQVIPAVIASLKEVTDVNTMVYFYQPDETEKFPMMIKNGKKNTPVIPQKIAFKQLSELLKNQPLIELNRINKKRGEELQKWLGNLKRDGYTHAAYMPLSNNQDGFLLMDEINNPDQIAEQIRTFRSVNETLFENARSFEEIEELSYTDNLTQLFNQRYFSKRLEEEFNRAERYNRLLALIIFDIDNLKSVNDRYGHLAGDELISRVASLLKKSIRTIDIISRYGGDEFCIIMPESDNEMCRKFMSRIQSTLSETEFLLEGADHPVKISLSMGAAVYPDHAEQAKDLIYKADMALLKAKKSGRNKFLISDPSN